MTDTPTTGGTVRYHRADYNPATDEPWLVWFTEDQADPYWFTAEQGEAMGLTPPAPAPLTPLDVISTIGVKFGNSRQVDYLLDRDDAEMVLDALAEAGYEVVLRDAHRDPQPASDEPTYFPDEGFNLAKRNVRTVTANVVQPAPAPSDDLDFDALPIGTVAEVTLLDGDRLLALKMDAVSGRKWFIGDCSDVDITKLRDVRIVHQPAPLSPGECLRGLLAGRDDADELIEYAKQWGGRGLTPDGRWRAVIGDAARGGA